MSIAAVKSDDGSTLTVEARLSTPDLWPWLTEPGYLTRWWPTAAEVDLSVGGTYRFIWPEWTLSGAYRTIEPPRRLSFTWSWEHDDLPPRVVDLDLSPGSDETLLVLRHGYGSAEERDGYRDGWLHFLGALEERVTE